MNTGLYPNGQLSLCHVPTTRVRSAANHRGHPHRRFATLPLTAMSAHVMGRASSFPSRLAGSSAESRSVSLRTGHPPPDAPHPASRRRDFPWFPGRRATAWGGFAPPGHVRLQAHWGPPSGGPERRHARLTGSGASVCMSWRQWRFPVRRLLRDGSGSDNGARGSAPAASSRHVETTAPGYRLTGRAIRTRVGEPFGWLSGRGTSYPRAPHLVA
jgi:hypothetical protein